MHSCVDVFNQCRGEMGRSWPVWLPSVGPWRAEDFRCLAQDFAADAMHCMCQQFGLASRRPSCIQAMVRTGGVKAGPPGLPVHQRLCRVVSAGAAAGRVQLGQRRPPQVLFSAAAPGPAAIRGTGGAPRCGASLRRVRGITSAAPIPWAVPHSNARRAALLDVCFAVCGDRSAAEEGELSAAQHRRGRRTVVFRVRSGVRLLRGCFHRGQRPRPKKPYRWWPFVGRFWGKKKKKHGSSVF